MTKTLLLILTLFYRTGNEPIIRPNVTWDDFRGEVPANEPTVGARTVTSIGFESMDSAGLFTCHVSAEFLPNESWVRVRSDYNLHHEMTHWRISQLEVALCNKALAKYQNKPLPSIAPVMKIYNHYQQIIDLLNEQFDKESCHGLNPTVEAIYEKRIESDLNKLQ